MKIDKTRPPALEDRQTLESTLKTAERVSLLAIIAFSVRLLPGLSTWPGACLLHSPCRTPGSAWLVPVPSSVVSETRWLPSFSSHSQLSDVLSLSLSCASPLLLLSVSLS